MKNALITDMANSAKMLARKTVNGGFVHRQTELVFTDVKVKTLLENIVTSAGLDYMASCVMNPVHPVVKMAYVLKTMTVAYSDVPRIMILVLHALTASKENTVHFVKMTARRTVSTKRASKTTVRVYTVALRILSLVTLVNFVLTVATVWLVIGFVQRCV